MSRNGSGTMSVINTFVPGGTITAASHNQNMSDVAAELTNSVAADGQTSMTGPLKAAIGTSSAPAITFASDTDTGIYRKASNTIAAVVGATEVIELSSTGAAVTGDVSATGVFKQAGFALQPVGALMGFAGSSAPSGWLLCYGQAVSRTTYAALFAVIGTTYGSGDGSTTFNIPDLRGRAIAGIDNMGGVSADRLAPGGALAAVRHTLGGAGGECAHTLTSAEIPTLTSTGSNSISVQAAGPLKGIPVTSTKANVVISSVGTGGGSGVASTAIGWAGEDTFSGTNSISVTSSGTSGNSHNNIQPTILLNQIIFAGV